MKKRKLKGFTLVELVVVMAIFAILMAAVMALINPVSKLMKKATIQEANAAAVDNVKRYIEGNLKYANAIEAHMGGIFDTDGTVLPTDDSNIEATLKEAAKNFAQQYYINRVSPVTGKTDGSNTPYQGKIRIMEIDNQNGGRINEYVVDFTAGYTVLTPDTTQFLDNGDPNPTFGYFAKKVNKEPVIDNLVKNANVINPAYYEHYSFYFEPGYKELVATDVDAADNDEYTATFKSIEVNGATYNSFTPEMFSMSVVTYKNDSELYPAAADDSGTTEVNETKLFESPFEISNITMSLVNVSSEFKKYSDLRQYYGPVRYEGTALIGTELKTYSATEMIDFEGNVEKPDESDGNWDYESASDLLNNSDFAQDKALWRVISNATTAPGPNIYFVYTLPEAK